MKQKEIQENKINKMIKNKKDINIILEKIKQDNLKANEHAIITLAINWKRNYKVEYERLNKNKEDKKLELIKTLITRGAIFNKKIETILEVNMEMKKEDIKNIVLFKDKYTNFINCTLKITCLNFFIENKINLNNFNVTQDLKEEFTNFSNKKIIWLLNEIATLLKH